MREKRGVCRHGGNDSNRDDVKGCQDMCQDMSMGVRICQGVPGFVKGCQDMSRGVRMCQGVSGYVNGC